MRFEGCGACVKVNLDIICGQDSGPEKTILRDSRVKIVDLCAPQLGVVDVNSDQRKGAVPNVTVSPPINTLQEGHVVHVRIQIFLDDAGPPVCLRRRGVDKGDAGIALEVVNGGRVAIGAGKRRSLNVILCTEKVQGAGSREHIADAGSGKSRQGSEESRTKRPTDHRCANRAFEEFPSGNRCVPR